MQRCLNESFSHFVGLVNLLDLFSHSRLFIDRQYLLCHNLLADWIMIGSIAGIHVVIDLSVLSDTLYYQIVFI
jgi:hypothetical protein